MANRKDAPEVNAGSMADIAFLLLIFFLVTTVIETDVGLDRMLTRIDSTPPIDIKEKNILQISINGDNQLLVERELANIKDLRVVAIAFLDNGGATAGDSGYCDYCRGERNPNSSDNPAKAIISITSHRETNYSIYIAVQNELTAAYNELRNREAQRLYKQDFTKIQAQFLNPGTPESMKSTLKEKVKNIQLLYPQNLLEAEIN